MAIPNTGNREELKFDTKEVSYEWEIDDFTTNRPHMKDIVNSQTFPREGLPQWYIQLNPRGKASQKRKFGVYLHLKKAESGQKTIVVDNNLQFLDDDGTEVHSSYGSGDKFDQRKGWGWGIVKDSNYPIPLSTLGKLIVRVTIFIRKPVRSDLIHSTIEIPKSSLIGDLQKSLKSVEYADFVVESGDGQVFPVHKNVLSSRNPLFFGLMFKTPMKEAIDIRVKLPFDAEIISALLEYVYTDAVVNLTAVAARLYPVAHQYQLDRLVVICAANLSQNLTVANMSVALGIAQLYEDAKLLSACQKFGSKPSGWDRIRKWFKRAQ